MYSGENSGIDLKDIIVKILFLVFFVLILLWLYPKMPDLGILTDRVYNENITTMKDAAVDYYTIDRLPKNDGDVSEMTLQKMLDLKLIVPFVDKDGNSCDTTNSYVQVTKDGDEYVLKTVLVCGKQNDYVVEYIGCHDVCDNGCDVKEETKTQSTNNNSNSNNNSGSNVTTTPGTSSSTTTTTKYTIKFKATNGTVGTSSVKVVKGKNTSTTAKPNSGYEYASVSCTNGQKATYSNNTIKVTKVTKSATCTVKFTKKAETEANKYTVKVAVVNGTSNVTTKEVVLNGSTTFAITANSGYNINNTNVTCGKTVTGVMSGSTLTIKDVKDNGTCVVTIGKSSYTNYTIKFSVVNGTSSVTSKTVAAGSTIMTTISPNKGYTIKNATVSCGSGLNYSLDEFTLSVKNIKTSGNCVVVLKQAEVSQYLNVSKTYYSTGYTTSTGTYSYTINLETLPKNVEASKVVAVGVSIKPMSSYTDFSSYVAAKKANEMTMVNGSGEYSVKYNTAATLQAHALTSSNFSTKATAGCTKSRCQVYITNTIKNFNGVTPTGEVELGNGSKVSGLYYVPVKFVVTFKHEK